MDDLRGDGEVAVDPRTLHFGEFYAVTEATRSSDVAVVMGNCQAESLRVMLHGAGLHTVRIPAVHELVATDIPHLHRLLERTTLLVSQPVRDDYHELPLGLRQLEARLTGRHRTVVVPVIRFAGLYPTHAIIRPPSDLSLTPPIVAYHELRTLVEASGGPRLLPDGLTSRQIQAIAEDSIAELVRREAAFDTVRVSELFAAPAFELMRTLNHPGNAVFRQVAARVRQRAGLIEHDVDPGRPLLNAVHAPRERAVIEHFGLETEPDDDWIVDGLPVSADTVRQAHLGWYREHPDAVTAGLARHARALEILAKA